MALVALNHDGVAARRGERFPDGVFRVQRVARLVLIGHFQCLRLAHAAFIRLDLPQQEAHQSRLARAVRADDADPVPAQDAQRQIIRDHEGAIRRVEGLGQILGLDHLLAHRIAA